MSPVAAEAEQEMLESPRARDWAQEQVLESPQGRDGVRRPTPLLLGPLLFGCDDERPLAPSPTYCMAIPVHRTFIEFGCLEHTPTGYRLAMRTAPACMAHHMREDLDAEAANWQGAHAHWQRHAGADDTIVAGPPGSAASSARQGSSDYSAAAHDAMLPAVTYRLSPTSAKASGYLLGGEVKEQGAPFHLDGRVDSSRSTDDDGGDCSGDEDEDLGLCPEYSAGAPLPSLGSAEHGEGNCRRCCFFPKGRCNNGYDCNFCHFAHEKRKPKNKKKSKHNKRRARTKSMMAAATGMEPYLVPMGVEFMGPNVHIVVDDSMHGQAVAMIPVCFYA